MFLGPDPQTLSQERVLLQIVVNIYTKYKKKQPRKWSGMSKRHAHRWGRRAQRYLSTLWRALVPWEKVIRGYGDCTSGSVSLQPNNP